MIGVNLGKVDAAGNYARPKAGGYVIRMTSVTNNAPNERLDIEFDFYEGEFKGYYKDLQERRGFWAGKFNKSYKEKARPFFKGFLDSVIKSNSDTSGLIIGDYEDVDETKLVGLTVGMVVGEKEYIGNDGLKKVKLDTYNATFIPADDIRSGSYEVPEMVLLEGASQPGGVVDTTNVVDTTANFGPVNDDDIPF